MVTNVFNPSGNFLCFTNVCFAKLVNCHITIDVVCVLIGFITGGPLGIATIILMFGTGPLISTWNKLVSKPIVEKFA